MTQPERANYTYWRVYWERYRKPRNRLGLRITSICDDFGRQFNCPSDDYPTKPLAKE